MKKLLTFSIISFTGLVLIQKLLVFLNPWGEGFNQISSLVLFSLIGIYFIYVSVKYQASETDKAFLLVSGITLIGLGLAAYNFSLELLKLVVVIFPLLIVGKLANRCSN